MELLTKTAQAFAGTSPLSSADFLKQIKRSGDAEFAKRSDHSLEKYIMLLFISVCQAPQAL
jgi:hypothetical protein